MRARRMGYWFIGLLGVVINVVHVLLHDELGPSGLADFLSEHGAIDLSLFGLLIPLFAVVGYLLLRYDRLFTERQQAQQALRKNTERLRTLIDQAADAIFVLDMEGRILEVNNQACESLGYTRAELLELNIADVDEEVVTHEHRRRFWEKLTSEQATVTLEGTQRRKDGTTFPVEIRVALLKSGAQRSIIGLVRDITERKRADKALRERVKELNCLYEISRVAASSADSTLGKMLEEIVNVLPGSWQYPDIASARIVVEGREYTSPNSQQSQWCQSADIRVHGAVSGAVRICYHEERPEADEGPFSKEERVLIEAVAERLGHIIERKQAEEELRESEERFRVLFDTAVDAIFLADPQTGMLLDANEAAENLTGHTHSELLEMHQAQLHPPDKVEQYKQMFAHHIEQGRAGDFEAEVICKDGSTVAVYISAAVTDVGGRQVLQGRFVDITDRKQAEEALRESEAKYRTLLETLPQNVFSKDTDLVYVACNENFARELGIAPEEFAGKTDYDFFPRELAEKYRADDKRVMESGQTEELEERYIRDGEEMIVHTVKTPIKDDNGNTLGILGIFWDITEQKQAEEALQAAYQRNETVLATSMDGFLTMGPDGTIGDCNKAFCEMVGYSRDELLAMKITDLEAVETPEETAQHIKEVMEAGGTRFETAHRRKDGTFIDLELSTTFVELPQDSFFVCFARDITETKKLWQELNQQLLRDALTGVYNRRYFNETIIQEIKRADRYKHHTSFIMGDVDGLKMINDNFGHLAGDQILQGVAGVLERSVRAADMVVRYGGDEFLVVMPETPEDQAQAALSRIEQKLTDWLTEQVEIGVLHSDVLAQVGFSMGVASCQPGEEVAIEELLDRADEAMYRAKEAKRRPQIAS